jgi:L-amino acid N-acyltransferase YncA
MKKGKKFIGTFVNEMYAILLGIGIGNVLFAQNLDLSNIYEVVMVLFVIGVILVYWWDWTEYVSENLVSSKVEFLIDFLILIALELLFSFFSSPYFLIRVFLGLGVLNLAWVINFNIHRKTLKSRKSLWWIFEKIIVIAVYITAFIFITFVIPRESIYISGGIIIVSFILVRFIGFTQLRGEQHPYTIRKAKPEDAQSITQLNNKWFSGGNNDRGFLVTTLEENEVKKDIEEGNTTYFIAEDKKDGILGFVSVIDSAEEEILDSVVWIDKDLEERFYESKKKYIAKVAVINNAGKKGIGKALYSKLFEDYPKHILYSFAAYSPRINEASIKFHSRMGFAKSGIFERKEFLGMKDYRSIFFTHN